MESRNIINGKGLTVNKIMPVNKSTDREKWLQTDIVFNRLYPVPMQNLSARHWTPLPVVRRAAAFLSVKKNVRILDIGSGIGKFCLAGACLKPGSMFFGVEQRENLVEYALAAKKELEVSNAAFIHGNFTQVDFREYDHFYFFNSFYENLTESDTIDDNIAYSPELFTYYNRYLYRQLEKKPAGTRLVTFHSMEEEIPHSYQNVGAEMENLLKYWVKE